MYLDLIESFAEWLQSRGTPPDIAMFRSIVAFSTYALACFVSAILLLSAFAEIPIADWIGQHVLILFPVAFIITFAHWFAAHKLKQRGNIESNRRHRVPSRYLWAWYFFPVLAFVALSVAIAITRARA